MRTAGQVDTEAAKGLIAAGQRDAQAALFETGRWAPPRIQELIEHEFSGTDYVKRLNRLLRRLGEGTSHPLTASQ